MLVGAANDPSALGAIRAFEEAGLAGMHLEDQVFPKRCGHLAGKELIPVEEMTEKIAAAARSRRDQDFLIVARTDARSVDGFEAAVRRAQSYLKAGADAVFPEALESAGEFRQFARLVRAPLLANSLSRVGRQSEGIAGGAQLVDHLAERLSRPVAIGNVGERRDVPLERVQARRFRDTHDLEVWRAVTSAESKMLADRVAG